jgi:hypothetical protein
MVQHARHFAEAAAEFCAWAEGVPSSAHADSSLALQHLSKLYQLALSLPDEFGDEEPGEIAQNTWESIYKRFGSLPFNYYAQCFTPTEISSEPPVVADLADDLADIWRDLKRGLSLYQSGHMGAAIWEWRQGFWQHWGHYAASAIYALHSWVAENPQVPPNNSFKPNPLRGSA